MYYIVLPINPHRHMTIQAAFKMIVIPYVRALINIFLFDLDYLVPWIHKLDLINEIGMTGENEKEFMRSCYNCF